MSSSARVAGGRLVVGMGVEPAARGEPPRRDVPVPTRRPGQDHLHEVVPQRPEGREEFGQREEVADPVRPAAHSVLPVLRRPPPVRVTDPDQPAGHGAAREQFHGAGQAAADPRRARADRRVDGRAVTGPVASPAHRRPGRTREFGGPGARPGEEDRRDVHAGAGDAVVPGPGAQQLAGAAARVERPGAGPQSERPAQRGELLRGQRVVHAVTARTDGVLTCEIHCGTSLW